MSRTAAITPARKSKRLLASGYYHPPTHETNNGMVPPSDDDDTASVDSNMSRSSFADNRSVHYEESSPIKQFNKIRRRRNHSGSPSRSPVLPSASKTVSADGNLNQMHGRNFRQKVVQKQFFERSSVVTSSRSASAVTRNEHALPHLFGLHEDDAGDTFAEGTSLKQPPLPFRRPVTDNGDLNAEKDQFKVPTATTQRRPPRKMLTSLSEDDSEGFETEDSGTAHRTVTTSTLLFFQHILTAISTKTSAFSWSIGQRIYQATTHLLLLDTWLLTHGIPLTSFKRLFKLLLLFIFVVLLLVFLVPYFSQTTTMIEQPTSSVWHSIQSALKQENQKYEKGFEDHQKSIQAEIQELQFTLQQLELKVADRQVSIMEKIDSLEKNHQKNVKEIAKSAESVSTIASLVDSSLVDKAHLIEKNFQGRLNDLHIELQQLKYNHSQSVERLRVEVSKSLVELSSRANKIESQFTQFEGYLKTINQKLDTMDHSSKEFQRFVEKTSSNVTYLKEITDKQFAENFLILLQKGTISDSKNGKHQHHHLSLVFLEWLKARGFVKKEDLQKVVDHNNQTFHEAMIKARAETARKIEKLSGAKSQESTITLDTLTSRSYKHSDVINEAVVKAWIKEALDTFGADRIGMPDYALESSGGYIVNTRCSETYHHKTALVSILGIPIFYNINTPRAAIQPNVLPGDCWAFKGSQGYVVIGLSAPIQPNSFTLEHIPRSLALYNNISSAPKDFTVHGLSDEKDQEGSLLGIYRYEEDGRPIQTFPVDASKAEQGRDFSFVELRIASNWGHPDFTCLYRFRVHGSQAI